MRRLDRRFDRRFANSATHSANADQQPTQRQRGGCGNPCDKHHKIRIHASNAAYARADVGRAPLRPETGPYGEVNTGAGIKARAAAGRVVPPYGMTHRMNAEKQPA